MLNKYLEKALKNYVDNAPHIRYGQALYNVLYDEYPDLAFEVNGMELDPFFISDASDIRVIKYLEWLKNKLENS